MPTNLLDTKNIKVLSIGQLGLTEDEVQPMRRSWRYMFTTSRSISICGALLDHAAYIKVLGMHISLPYKSGVTLISSPQTFCSSPLYVLIDLSGGAAHKNRCVTLITAFRKSRGQSPKSDDQVVACRRTRMIASVSRFKPAHPFVSAVCVY